jgi:hypothetical protein
MLLVLTVEGYAAISIHPSLKQCEQYKLAVEDKCVSVEVRFAQMGPAL